MPNKAAYQTMKVMQGGAPRRVYGAKARIQREAHAVAIVATDGETAKHKPMALWATDLRRGRLNVYGSLLRVIDLLHAKGFPLETALIIPRLLEEYVRELWSDRPDTGATISQKKAA